MHVHVNLDSPPSIFGHLHTLHKSTLAPSTHFFFFCFCSHCRYLPLSEELRGCDCGFVEYEGFIDDERFSFSRDGD